MARKDSEKDSERPHYYSQFWLDVAAGRRIIGAPKPGEEAEGEVELPEPPTPPRRAGRMGGGREEPFMSPAPSNGYSENIAHPVAEPIVEDEEIMEPETEDLQEDEEQDYQDDLEDTDIPDMDLTSPDEEEEDLYEEEEGEEEEDEDDIGWSGRGRKRNKPTRAPKQPVRKPPKREPRRGY